MRNPFAQSDFDMQDLRGDHYAVMPPISTLLRWEALGALAVALLLYQHLGFSWGQFFTWVLLPDLAILVNVFGSDRAGMWAYNITHCSAGAAVLAVVGVLTSELLWQQMALIWWAHIAFDRAWGYGLKFALGFRVTHLGVIGGRWRV